MQVNHKEQIMKKGLFGGNLGPGKNVKCKGCGFEATFYAEVGAPEIDKEVCLGCFQMLDKEGHPIGPAMGSILTEESMFGGAGHGPPEFS